jgi:tripartite-type tricarboxylate transporter receptor subunit TctC
MSILRTFILLFMAAQFTGAAHSQEANGYPARTVKVVVPFGPGGPTDVFARLVAQRLSQRLGQQFYIENQGGAGGNLGMGIVARSKPDGHTILVVSSSFIANPSLYAKIPYDPYKDFEPITLAAVTPNIVTVHPSVPAKSVKELIELIKSNPGKYSFASPGAGTTPHLSGELFRISQALDIVHVPFNGSAPAIQSVLGGHTPIGFTVMTPAVAQIREGKIRGVAVTTERRTSALPDVATLEEGGLTGQQSDTMQGFLAPVGTPKEIINLLQREIVAAMDDPEIKSKMVQFGFEPVGSSPEEFRKRIGMEIPKWAKIIKDANIKAD